MAENTGLSAADVALLNGDGMGGGWNGMIWLFAILALMGGGFGGNWGGNNGAVNALNADMQRGFDTQNLQAQTRDILSAVTGGTAQTIAASTQNAANAITAIKDGNASLIREFGNVETGLTALSGAMQECCCGTKMLVAETSAGLAAQIAQNRYENALALAGMEQRITAKMDQNEITSLRDQISQLQLAQATSGMLKFPNSWAYGAGPFPPIFGCPGNNI